MNREVIEIIQEVAKIPSFSSYEERIHPFIFDFIEKNQIPCEVHTLYNNLIIEIKKSSSPPFAFTAHLDKIDHFRTEIEELPFEIKDDLLIGQLDDSVGVGICLYLLKNADKFHLPHSLFLFSEMEEGYGYRRHRSSLKNQGKGLSPQIGAERISIFLLENKIIPKVFVTIDTTPMFAGESGIALYSRYWEYYAPIPGMELLEVTHQIEQLVQEIHPEIKLSNSVNDYLRYGNMFAHQNLCVPSIAIEPAIYPIHTIGEKVRISDIEKVVEIVVRFVEEYGG